jgi:hypothetical protein
MATSTLRRASSEIAAAVSASNSVGGPMPVATRSMAGRTWATAAANSAALMGSPSIATRSR